MCTRVMTASYIKCVCVCVCVCVMCVRHVCIMMDFDVMNARAMCDEFHKSY